MYTIPGMSYRLESFVQFVTMLIIFVLVLAATYATTRFIANYQKGAAGAGKNIQVIETFRLTTNKYIQIIKTGEKYLVIGIGKDTITMLAELSKEEISFVQEQAPAVLNFKDVLEKVKSFRQKK